MTALWKIKKKIEKEQKQDTLEIMKILRKASLRFNLIGYSKIGIRKIGICPKKGLVTTDSLS